MFTSDQEEELDGREREGREGRKGRHDGWLSGRKRARMGREGKDVQGKGKFKGKRSNGRKKRRKGL